MTETTATPPDPKAELAAMQAVTDALTGLDPAVASRVLRWASEALGIAGAVPAKMSASALETLQVINGIPARQFGTLGELYSAASPETDVDRALVAGYWCQFFQNEPEFGAQQINTELKHLGYRVEHITTALDALKGKKPALVVQLKKAGSTRQARKTFKLTAAGKQAVELMIQQG